MTSRSLKFALFTDESGNSGVDLYSEPSHFWTGTLIVPVERVGAADDLLRTVAARLDPQSKSPELHGNKLGVRRISENASDLIKALTVTDARIVFTRVEKSHVSRLKFFDAVFDSGVNAAVSPVHYGVRLLRLTLAQYISGLMGYTLGKRFWPVFLDPNETAFVDVLYRVEGEVLQHVRDDRARKLLLDGLRWAIKNPKTILENRGDVYDAPNIVALSLLLWGLNRMFGKGVEVSRFVHDETDQFARAIDKIWETGKNYRAAFKLQSVITDIVRVPEQRAAVEFRKSSDEPLLQLVDVALWLTRRSIDDGNDLRDGAADLQFEIFDRALFEEFSHQALIEEVRKMQADLDALPALSSKKLAKARGLLETVESARVERRDRSSR